MIPRTEYSTLLITKSHLPWSGKAAAPATISTSVARLTASQNCIIIVCVYRDRSQTKKITQSHGTTIATSMQNECAVFSYEFHWVADVREHGLIALCRMPDKCVEKEWCVENFG